MVALRLWAYAYFLFQLGPTNEGVHKGPQKPSYATACRPIGQKCLKYSTIKTEMYTSKYVYWIKNKVTLFLFLTL